MTLGDAAELAVNRRHEFRFGPRIALAQFVQELSELRGVRRFVVRLRLIVQSRARRVVLPVCTLLDRVENPN